MEFVANTVIFVVCGMLIAGWVYRAHQPGGPWTLQGRDYAFAVALWLLLLVFASAIAPSQFFPKQQCPTRLRIGPAQITAPFEPQCEKLSWPKGSLKPPFFSHIW